MCATPHVTLYKEPAPVAALGAEPDLMAGLHPNSPGSEMSLLLSWPRLRSQSLGEDGVGAARSSTTEQNSLHMSGPGLGLQHQKQERKGRERERDILSPSSSPR